MSVSSGETRLSPLKKKKNYANTHSAAYERTLFDNLCGNLTGICINCVGRPSRVFGRAFDLCKYVYKVRAVADTMRNYVNPPRVCELNYYYNTAPTRFSATTAFRVRRLTKNKNKKNSKDRISVASRTYFELGVAVSIILTVKLSTTLYRVLPNLIVILIVMRKNCSRAKRA